MSETGPKARIAPYYKYQDKYLDKKHSMVMVQWCQNHSKTNWLQCCPEEEKTPTTSLESDYRQSLTYYNYMEFKQPTKIFALPPIFELLQSPALFSYFERMPKLLLESKIYFHRQWGRNSLEVSSISAFFISAMGWVDLNSVCGVSEIVILEVKSWRESFQKSWLL